MIPIVYGQFVYPEQSRILFSVEDFQALERLMELHEKVLSQIAAKEETACSGDIPELVLIGMITAVNTPGHDVAVAELIRELTFLEPDYVKSRMLETMQHKGKKDQNLREIFLPGLLSLEADHVSQAFKQFSAELRKTHLNQLATLLKQARKIEKR
jgi:hypothetical protein